MGFSKRCPELGLKALVNALARPVDQRDGIEFDGCGIFVKHYGCL
jgi:hypothetical protein